MKDKKLKELLESQILTDETKTVLQESWDAAVEQNRAELETEYAARLTEAREELLGKVGELVEESIATEFGTIAEELAEARDLEVTYAEKLETFKEQYAEKTQETVEQLVTESVTKEVEELKEDIDFARKHQFVMAMFESYKEVYAKMFGSADVDVHKELEEAVVERDALKREKIIGQLLESVTGEKRGVVETILEGVATEKLEAKFESLRPVILGESAKAAEEKLEEGAQEKPKEEGTVVMESGEGAGEKERIVSDPVFDRLNRSLQRINR